MSRSEVTAMRTESKSMAGKSLSSNIFKRNSKRPDMNEIMGMQDEGIGINKNNIDDMMNDIDGLRQLREQGQTFQ